MDDFISRAVCGPEGFRFSCRIVCNHTICRIQDILRGTVILLELNDLAIFIFLFELQDIADIGSPPAINGLVIITHYTNILVGS